MPRPAALALAAAIALAACPEAPPPADAPARPPTATEGRPAAAPTAPARPAAAAPATPEPVRQAIARVARERSEAVATLVRLGEPARPAVLRLLESANLEEVRGALDWLDALGPAGAAPSLAARLDHPLAEARRRALELLGRAGADAAAHAFAIADRLDDADPTVAVAAARALGALGDDAVATDLARAAGHPDEQLAAAAAAALAALGTEPALAPLRAALEAPDADPRAAWLALRALRLAGRPLPAGTALQASRAAAPLVAAEAARHLAAAEEAEAGPRLEELARDPRPAVRRAALEALVQRGSDATLPAALVALAEGDGTVKAAAAAALAAVAPPAEVARRLAPFATAPDRLVRAAVVAELGATGSPEAVRPLADLLAIEQVPWLRRDAAAALAGLRTLEAAPALVAVLDDPRDPAWAAAARGLEALSGERHPDAAAWRAWLARARAGGEADAGTAPTPRSADE